MISDTKINIDLSVVDSDPAFRRISKSCGFDISLEFECNVYIIHVKRSINYCRLLKSYLFR